MTPAPEEASEKISKHFAERLKRLAPGDAIRAIVLPAITPNAEGVRAVDRAARRQAAADTIAAVMQTGFRQTDWQFSKTGGRRLTQEPNRLGFIHIEAPATSIFALAGQDWVQSIIEDQPVRPN